MNEIFGKRLKALRTEKGYTQQELADKLGISPSSVGMYEQGRREPDNTKLSKICEIFDVTTDYLIGFSPQKESQEVSDVIDDFTKMLMSQQGLMFDGQPMTEDDREKIVIAIQSATAVVNESIKNKGGHI